MNPLVVIWRLTEACDLACPYCRYSRELTWPRTAWTAEAVLAFGRALADYAEQSGRRALVSWLGGEPLLWPHLDTVSRILHGWGLQLGVTTNGTRLDRPAVRALLAECYAQLTVSVDGVADRHDALRGRGGLWETLQAGVRHLRARAPGLWVRANTVLTRASLPGFADLCAALADWGVNEVTFNALGGRERGGAFFTANHLRPADVAALQALLPAVRQAVAPMRVAGTPAYLRRLEKTALGLAWPVADCAPGAELWFVDECGRVAPCSFTGAVYGVPVTELTPAAMSHLPARWSAMRAERGAPACADCQATHVFGKFAPAEKNNENNAAP